MLITAEVVRRGCCSASVLSSLLGLWVHVLMFRRPAFSLLSACFKDACHVLRESVFQLGRKTLNELHSLSLLAPLVQADVRVSYLPFVFCMDASPGGAGLCVADAPVHVARDCGVALNKRDTTPAWNPLQLPCLESRGATARPSLVQRTSGQLLTFRPCAETPVRRPSFRYG